MVACFQLFARTAYCAFEFSWTPTLASRGSRQAHKQTTVHQYTLENQPLNLAAIELNPVLWEISYKNDSHLLPASASIWSCRETSSIGSQCSASLPGAASSSFFGNAAPKKFAMQADGGKFGARKCQHSRRYRQHNCRTWGFIVDPRDGHDSQRLIDHTLANLTTPK